jgi:hypothetical protein
MAPRRTKKSTNAEVPAPNVSLPVETSDPPPAKKSRGHAQKVTPRNDVSAPAPSEEAPVTKKRT